MSLARDGEVLIKQGAEALAFKSTFLPSLPAALRKHRPPKPYRHPVLDRRLTKHRILAEARLLQRCRKNGIATPALYFIDEKRGDLWMEFIEGRSLRDVLLAVEREPELQGQDGSKRVPEVGIDVVEMMKRTGEAIAMLHEAGVIHGDLTTSNLMRREPGRDPADCNAQNTGEIVIIDLGLGSISLANEDKAVDLYVLERAFLSTHPRSTHLFASILEAYAQSGGTQTAQILKRLEDVRLRGRKRTMVG